MMYVCIYVCMYASMYVCIYVCMYICMYECMYVCYKNIYVIALIYLFAQSRLAQINSINIVWKKREEEEKDEEEKINIFCSVDKCHLGNHMRTVVVMIFSIIFL